MSIVPATAKKIIGNVEKVIIGKRQEVILALTAWFCEGHILLEDVPGVAKTMLARAIARSRKLPKSHRPRIARADVRLLPFRPKTLGMVLAPYGMLQSLTRERDLRETLGSVARVLKRGGLFGIDLVPDLPRWSEYKRRVTLSGARDARTHLTLRETVRQDRRRRLTMFDQEYVERRGMR